MKRILAVILTVCMALTGALSGIPQSFIPGNDSEASAASCPALKTIDYKATGNQRDDIIGFAKTQVGYKEGSNNNTYFGKWYGCNYNAWCAMFVCWCAAKAGVSKSVIPRLAVADRSWAKNQGVYHKSKYWGGNYTPKKGDLIYFSWSVRDWADHIGMVSGTGKSGGTKYVYTIEGNKRDMVTEGSYPLNNKYILGYASPKYTTGNAEETTEPEVQKYTLKYRDGLDSTSNDEEDKIIPPAEGTFGKDLVLSQTRFDRSGYDYSQWDVYRENTNGKLIYLCRNSSGTEKWYKKASIPEEYTQVLVDCGGALNISKTVSGTVYASPVWIKGKYTVRYDANGGTGAPAAQTKEKDKDLTISETQPTREGYVFKGWALDKDASSPDYKSGSAYKDNAGILLYAVWKEDINKDLTSYTLEYSDGVKKTTDDTSIIPPVTAEYGKAVKVSEKKFTKTGNHYSKWQVYRLSGSTKLFLCTDKKNNEAEEWYKKSAIPDDYEKVMVKPGKKLTIKNSVSETIYIMPNWELDTYTVKYKAGKGKSAPKKQTKKYNKDLTLRAGEPVRNNYVFQGWDASSEADSVEYKAGGTYTKNKAVTLYAVWEREGLKVKTIDEANKRKGPGINYDVVGVLAKGKTVYIVKQKNGWGKLSGGSWIHMSLVKKVKSATAKSSAKPETGGEDPASETSDEPAFTVVVTSENGANGRTGPTTKNDIVNSYEEEEELTIELIRDGWGKIDGREEWILLKNTEITDGYIVKIDEDDLNQRTGPGMKYDTDGVIDPGNYEISKIDGEWGKVRKTGKWINLSYAERVI